MVRSSSEPTRRLRQLARRKRKGEFSSQRAREITGPCHREPSLRCRRGSSKITKGLARDNGAWQQESLFGEAGTHHSITLGIDFLAARESSAGFSDDPTRKLPVTICDS